MCEGSRAVSNSCSAAASAGSSGASWSTTSTWPPGRVTRASSATTRSGRATWWSVRCVPARSNAASGNGSAVPSPSTNSRVRQGACAREREQLGHRVDAHDLAHERGERERERAGSGADVERALVAGGPTKSRTSVRELGARVLARGDPLRRSREAVSRRRHGARGRDGVDPAGDLVADRPGDAAWRSMRRPSPTIVTGVPTGSSRSSSTATASIETVPTTGRGSPSTSTSVPLMSRRNPSA